MSAPSTRNITRTFRLASASDRADGRSWYARAGTLARELAEGRQMALALDLTEEQREHEYVRAAAVIAVLSPCTSWPQNVRLAGQAYALALDETMAQSEFVTLMKTTTERAVKAWLLLNNEDPEDVVKGPKVRTFWRTIADPFDPRAVVVDRHAIDVACNEAQSDAERARLVNRVGAYDALADMYRRAAQAINRDGRYGTGWSPAEVQAVTWCYWRRERAQANHG